MCTVLPPKDARNVDERQDAENTIRDYLRDRGVQSLVRTTTADDPFQGAERLVDDYGIGSLKPNTIMLGHTEDPDHQVRYCEMIRHLYELKRNVVILRGGYDGFGERRQIDVWWSGLTGNGGLMKILAYLLQTSIRWQDAEVRLNVVAESEEAAQQRDAELRPVVEQLRTGAKLNIIVGGGRSFDEVLHDTSADADIIFIGMATPDEQDDYAAYYSRLQDRTEGLPPTVFVLAAEDISYREVLA